MIENTMAEAYNPKNLTHATVEFHKCLKILPQNPQAET